MLLKVKILCYTGFSNIELKAAAVLFSAVTLKCMDKAFY